MSDCCSLIQREQCQRAKFWPAASLCHHTAFVQRVDLERTFQRRKTEGMTENTEMGNERTPEQEEKGLNRRKKIITKGKL